jgi:adenylosuccinate lyase
MLVQVPPFSPEAVAVLETLCGDQFSMDVALRVKDVERRTNHDVKAVEYVLRETMQTNEELTKARSSVTLFVVHCSLFTISRLFLSLSLSILSQSFCLSVCLSLCRSVCPSVCLLVHLSFFVMCWDVT